VRGAFFDAGYDATPSYLAEPCGASFRAVAGSQVVFNSMIPRTDDRCGRMASSPEA